MEADASGIMMEVMLVGEVEVEVVVDADVDVEVVEADAGGWWRDQSLMETDLA